MNDGTPGADVGVAASVLVLGRTCWRIERARRIAFLIDGESCFAAMRRAIAAAERSVLILAWDIDSRMRLCPGGADDGWPEPLGPFLEALVRARPSLQVHVLSWDYSVIFALEREWLSTYRFGTSTHPRLHFCLDDCLPIGASHHQKIVVVDDAIAFVGGLDPTFCRWDTPAHRADEPLRRDAEGHAYRPFHDVQALVDGPLARALGDLARERWRRATGEALAAPPAPLADPWPAEVAVDLREVDVGVARTEGEHDGHARVTEIREVLLAAIAAARRSIYLEHQFFTAACVGEALRARVGGAEGPEIVLVMGQRLYGWLEERTMGVLRSRLDRSIRAADHGGRYHVYAPNFVGREGDEVNIHSKVTIVDDELLIVGTANLSNRSMGLDSECDLVIEARGDPRVQAAIARLRARLLGEHLGASPAAVAAAEERSGGLVAAIEALRGGERTLTPFVPRCSPSLDAVVPRSAIVDPEEPIAAEQAVEELFRHGVEPSVRRRVLIFGAVAALIVLLIVLWRLTPLAEIADPRALVALSEGLQGSIAAPLVAPVIFVVGGLVAFPVSALIAATGLAFSPWVGVPVAITGALASASVGYAIGARLGCAGVRRLAGARVGRLSERLARRGALAVAIVRVIPIAPFTVVNLVAGASHIRLRDYLVGTVLGMTPGIVVTILLIDRALEAAIDPEPREIVALFAVGAGVIALTFWLGRRLARATRSGP